MTRRTRLIAVNALTLCRVPLVVIFAVAAVMQPFRPEPWIRTAALVSLVLAALTDTFDGQLARRWQVASRFGAVLDPMADKVFYLVTLPVLLYLVARCDTAAHAIVLLVLTILFTMRDQWVTFLRSVATEFGADVRANWAGKLRTAASFPIACAIYVYAAWRPGWMPTTLLYALEALLIAVNILSVVVYTRRYAPLLRRSLRGSG